jgi:hypothetical protein
VSRTGVRWRALAVAAAAALLVGCDLTKVGPDIALYAGANASSPVIPSDHYIETDPTATTITLYVTATGRNPIETLRCTDDGADVVPTQVSRGVLSWAATYQITLPQLQAELQFTSLDTRLNETVRVMHLYFSPDIIGQVLLEGIDSTRVQNHWAGDPTRLLVTLRQDIAGSYDITVAEAAYDPSAGSYAAATPVPYSTGLLFPAAAGRYQFTVRAQDAASGAGENVTFPVYLQSVSTTDNWNAPAAAGAYPHRTAGRNLVLSFGDLDTAVGAGLWVVEVLSSTKVRSATTGTSITVPFDDVGEYLVRVGVRAQAGATVPYTYTGYRSTGYLGQNTAPNAPTATSTPATLSASGTHLTFSVGAVDPDGDAVSFQISTSGLNVSTTYNSANGGSYSIAGTYSPGGTFGATKNPDGSWVFDWDIKAGELVFGTSTPPSLHFTAYDQFGAYSATPLTVSFAVGP